MTEAEWFTCADPDRMQEFLRRAARPSDRKFRLFGSACCRRIWSLLERRNRQAVEIIERFADGLATEADLRQARDVARQGRDAARAVLESGGTATGGAWLGACATLHGAAAGTAWKAALHAADSAAEASSWVTAATATGAARRRADADADQTAPWTAARKATLTGEEREQATLLRDIFGNPFRPYPTAPFWSGAVLRLAEALYAGADCAFALHDALLEAGHADLAHHFHGRQWHPKGCSVVDLILGKE
jgi:hypothetical protein